MADRFWYEDLGALVARDRLASIVPTRDMSEAEKLNTIVRFALYYSVIMVLIRRSIHHVYVFIFVALCTIAVYYNDKMREGFELGLRDKLGVVNPPCKQSFAYRPSRDNPFMNVMGQDRLEFPNRPAADNVRREPVRKEMQRLFYEGFPQDDHDVYNTASSERQFYTMPVTTIPNDQAAYANWLYAPGKTRKTPTRVDPWN